MLFVAPVAALNACAAILSFNFGVHVFAYAFPWSLEELYRFIAARRKPKIHVRIERQAPHPCGARLKTALARREIDRGHVGFSLNARRVEREDRSVFREREPIAVLIRAEHILNSWLDNNRL